MNPITSYNKERVFPILSYLKHLELRFPCFDDSGLCQLTCFINACPRLHKLVRVELVLSVEKAVKCSHQFLKVVEIVGFEGCTSDFQLFEYLTESAVKLEKIVINPVRFHSLQRNHEVKREEKARDTRVPWKV